MSSLLSGFASSIILGSADITPSVSFTSITSSAFRQFASTMAVVSLPPLPRVVILPFSSRPRKPQTTIIFSPSMGSRNRLTRSQVFSMFGDAFLKLESVMIGHSSLFGSKYMASAPKDFKAEQKIRALILSPMETISA